MFLVERWCSRLTTALYERFVTELDAAQKYRLQVANAALKKNRILIERGFTDEFVKAIAKDAAVAAPGTAEDAANSFSVPSFGEVELMKDDQVHLAVEGARLRQIAARACEAGFGGFCARLSAVQGFQLVRTKGNALRPEVFAGALLKLLQSLDVNSATRGCWLLDGAEIMGVELQALYVSLTQFLLVQSALPAGKAQAAPVVATKAKITEIMTPSEKLSSPSTGFASDLAKPVENAEAPKGEPAELLTLDNLHRLLVGERDSALEGVSLLSSSQPDEAANYEFAHTLPAALYVLAELEARKANITTPGLQAPSESVMQLRTHLKKTAKSLGQSLAIEVIGVMIEQIANNSKLLRPVRQVIAEAEPAFLRLAVTDPRFFSDKHHPARRLLDSITSASMGFSSEAADGFPAFMETLRQVALQLTEVEAGDAQHFARLLEGFESKQDRHSTEYRQSQQRGEQALLQAELRNLVAVKITAEVKARWDLEGVKPVVSAFLTGPWTQVLANERLLSGDANPTEQTTAAEQTLHDVLRTMKLGHPPVDHKWLVDIIPGMLKSLREGLVSIEFPLVQAKPFFDEVRACHRSALDASGPVPAPAPALAATPAPAPAPLARLRSASKEMFVTDDDDQSSVQPWIAPAEAEDSGFMQEIDVAGLSFEPLPQLTPLPDALSIEMPALTQVSNLQLGAWIELLVDARWLRAQLTWVSPRNTLFMFTSNGGRKHSMTVRILHHLLEKRFIKVISQQGVLDSALDNVAQTAVRNSIAST